MEHYVSAHISWLFNLRKQSREEEKQKSEFNELTKCADRLFMSDAIQITIRIVEYVRENVEMEKKWEKSIELITELWDKWKAISIGVRFRIVYMEWLFLHHFGQR